MRKIKVLRIIARLNIGGPARHTILLSERLNKDIFETILVYGLIGKNEGDMAYLAAGKRIKSVVIPELGRRISWKNDFIAFGKLYRLLERERPDIIHTHTAKAGTIGRLAGMLYNVVHGIVHSPQSTVQRKRRCKLIHTFHGHVLHSYFGKAKSKMFIWIERILAKFTDRIIAVNGKLKEDLLNFAIGNPDKITVIPLGLDLDKLLALENSKRKSENDFSVGIVGRLVPVKNHRMFLEAVKELQTTNCELRANFFIIGDGELREQLQEYAKQLNIEGNVFFTGWKKDLDEVCSNLDIIALTSLNEGTPVSLIEAMAAGRPVVATDVGGVGDLVTSHKSYPDGHRQVTSHTRMGTGKSQVTSHALMGTGKLPVASYHVCERGILVDSGDVKGFAGGLSMLLNDRQLREKMGQSGREFVRNKFSGERLINGIENLYKELVTPSL